MRTTHPMERLDHNTAPQDSLAQETASLQVQTDRRLRRMRLVLGLAAALLLLNILAIVTLA